MTVSLIAAIGENMELGKNNSLIWHLPDDLKFFKNTTMGKSVIMGRKTFESLPKALPGRKNIVITRNEDYSKEGAHTAFDIESALKLSETEEVFIIGGETIYREYLPFADKIYLTEIDETDDSADAFFPEFDKSKFRKTTIGENENNGIKFKHILYERI